MSGEPDLKIMTWFLLVVEQKERWCFGILSVFLWSHFALGFSSINLLPGSCLDFNMRLPCHNQHDRKVTLDRSPMSVMILVGVLSFLHGWDKKFQYLALWGYNSWIKGWRRKRMLDSICPIGFLLIFYINYVSRHLT